MKPKFINENCDRCQTKLVHYREIDPLDSFEDEYYCPTCKEIIPDWEEDFLNFEMDDMGICIDLEDIEGDLTPELKAIFEELKESFPKEYDIKIHPKAVEKLKALSQHSDLEAGNILTEEEIELEIMRLSPPIDPKKLN